MDTALAQATATSFLNAGCGSHYLDGWLNADSNPDASADVCCDLDDLPIPAGTVGRIFAAHVLEHLEYRTKLPKVLSEFRRVLRPGGELCVVGPDIQRAVLLGEPSQMLQAIVAWSPEFYAGEPAPTMMPPIGHAWTATGLLVEMALERAGFAYQNFTGRLHKLPQLGWPLGNLSPYQNAYICEVQWTGSATAG